MSEVFGFGEWEVLMMLQATGSEEREGGEADLVQLYCYEGGI